MPTEDVLQEIRDFVAERDWAQFHTPANLAKSVMIEGAELLELFQWDDNFDRDAVLDELADVMTYGILLADKLDSSVSEIVSAKLAKTRSKYPVDLARGTSEKYDRLQG